MIQYELQESPYGEIIVRISDGVVSFIPSDPDNRDYQEYLEQLENEGL
jgi:hypothetical protein